MWRRPACREEEEEEGSVRHGCACSPPPPRCRPALPPLRPSLAVFLLPHSTPTPACAVGTRRAAPAPCGTRHGEQRCNPYGHSHDVPRAAGCRLPRRPCSMPSLSLCSLADAGLGVCTCRVAACCLPRGVGCHARATHARALHQRMTRCPRNVFPRLRGAGAAADPRLVVGPTRSNSNKPTLERALRCASLPSRAGAVTQLGHDPADVHQWNMGAQRPHCVPKRARTRVDPGLCAEREAVSFDAEERGAPGHFEARGGGKVGPRTIAPPCGPRPRHGLRSPVRGSARRGFER